MEVPESWLKHVPSEVTIKDGIKVLWDSYILIIHVELACLITQVLYNRHVLGALAFIKSNPYIYTIPSPNQYGLGVGFGLTTPYIYIILSLNQCGIGFRFGFV